MLSELPPTPTPRLRITTRHPQSRAQILKRGITLLIGAHGGLAFRDRPVVITASARIGSTTVATLARTPIRPRVNHLMLTLTRGATATLRRHRRAPVLVTVTTRGPGGTQRRHLAIPSAR